MMSPADILAGLLRTNLAAGAAIVGVVAVRKLIRPWFGARLAYGLWLLPVFAGTAVLLPAREVLVERPTTTGIHQALQASPAMGVDPPMLMLGAWLAGVAVAILVMACLQHRFMKQARGGGVGPAVVGVIAPHILTPRDFAERYSPGEQTLVLAHEQAHIARQDSRLNGLCAGAQCLFWFNPLIHLAARLMRIDQELACDEAVVSRFPTARRAYAEVLVKAQLAVLPLPLGCYWPPATEHPLVERIAMLRQKGGGPARRSAGAAALAALCASAGLAAWASQPADVRVITLGPESVAAAHGSGAQTPSEGSAVPRPVKAIGRNGPSDRASAKIMVARNEASSTPDSATEETGAASDPPARDIAPIDTRPTPRDLPTEEAGSLRIAASQSRRTDDSAPPTALQPPVATAQAAAPPQVLIKISQKTGLADDPDQILCKVQPVTGSRFIKQVCITRREWKWWQSRLLSLERHWLIDPSGYSAAEY